MAEIVQSLFGVTPEMYQQSQQARADQQALQYAQLTPFQQANYAISRGANMLGGAVARGLGGEDPELARITARQQISGQINYADPRSIARGVEMLQQAGDGQGAMMLADVYRKAESERALAAQRTAEKMTPQERNAAAYARSVAEPGTPQYNQIYQTTLQSLISQEKPDLTTPAQKNARDFALRAGPEGSPAFTDAYYAKLEEFTSKPEPVGKTPTKIGVAAEGKKQVVYYDPNKDEQFVLDVTADGKQVRKPYTGSVDTKTMDIRLPGQPVKAKDWMDFTQNVLSKDPIMQDTSRILSEGPKLIGIINNATSNDISAAALPKALSAFIGKDSSLSNLDIQTFARTGGLDNRLASDVNKFFTGRATEVKKEQAQQFAIAVYRGALLERKKKLQESVTEYGYEDTPNYKFALESIDKQLAQFKLVKKGETPPATTTQSDEELLKKYPAKEKN
jgi:hypothetical protein